MNKMHACKSAEELHKQFILSIFRHTPVFLQSIIMQPLQRQRAARFTFYPVVAYVVIISREIAMLLGELN